MNKAAYKNNIQQYSSVIMFNGVMMQADLAAYEYIYL